VVGVIAISIGRREEEGATEAAAAAPIQFDFEETMTGPCFRTAIDLVEVKQMVNNPKPCQIMHALYVMSQPMTLPSLFSATLQHLLTQCLPPLLCKALARLHKPQKTHAQ
jgi:hypothetical protein